MSAVPPRAPLSRPRKPLGHCHQGSECPGADQRHVAVEHQHRAVLSHRGQRLQHRVAGPQLLLLDNPVERITRQGGTHRIRAMAHHHVHGGGLEGPGGAHDVFQQRSPRQRVQHFRQGGFHPGALPRCEYYDFKLHNYPAE